LKVLLPHYARFSPSMNHFPLKTTTIIIIIDRLKYFVKTNFELLEAWRINLFHILHMLEENEIHSSIIKKKNYVCFLIIEKFRILPIDFHLNNVDKHQKEFYHYLKQLNTNEINTRKVYLLFSRLRSSCEFNVGDGNKLGLDSVFIVGDGDVSFIRLFKFSAAITP